MESGLSLLLVVGMDDKLNGSIYIKRIVSDDDSTLRLHCKNIRHGGKLPNKILQAGFLVDPSHMIKYTLKPIFNL